MPFLPRDGRSHLRYSLHLPTKGWPGWVGPIDLENTGMVGPPNTNPSTNRARRSLTLLIWRTPLPLRQTSHRVVVWLGPSELRKDYINWSTELIPDNKEGSALSSIICERWQHSQQQRLVPSVRQWERGFTVYWFPICTGRLRRDCQCCELEAQCSRRIKINWTKTANNTHAHVFLYVYIHADIQTHTHTHTHNVVWLRVEHRTNWRPQL